MVLFGKSKEEKASEVQRDIKKNNGWFAQEIPKTIIINIPNGENGKTLKYFKTRGCYYAYAYNL